MFGWIKQAYDWASGRVDSTIASWVRALISGLYSFMSVIFGRVSKAWHDLWRAANMMRSRLDVFGRDIVTRFTEVYGWINKEGRLVYCYITHPSKLAALVFDALIVELERQAWSVGERLGKFFLSLILHNIKRFALLVEDILDAIL